MINSESKYNWTNNLICCATLKLDDNISFFTSEIFYLSICKMITKVANLFIERLYLDYLCYENKTK